ncbi:amidohydrolase family protein [Streptosporangium sp. NPDC051023]|uniref:amidohydrolase family protein n=1 Tax=Streptosporangium sp. NPDC051023 TaxID=3155410 RepID=UPI00344D4E9E
MTVGTSEAAPVPIYDGHCHVASTDFIPTEFIEDVVGNVHRRLEAEGVAPRRSRLVDAYVAQHQDHHADQLVKEMDASGVGRAVLLVPDFTLRMTAPLSIEEMARRHHEIRLRHPGRFWVYLGVDPRRGPEGVDVFERLVGTYGFDGLKLYPPCGYSPSDRALYPYYEVCAALSLPVFLHTGPTAGSLDFAPAHPLNVDQAARDFPLVDFVLGHGGVTHVDVAAYLAAFRRNVYLDIGGFAGAATPGGWPAHLRHLFRLGLNHKIIFGTDWPLNRMSGGLGRLIEEVVHGPQVLAGLPHRERALILHRNLLRVLPARSRPVPVS